MENTNGSKSLMEYFEDVKTTEPHDGYFCSVGVAITIVILGSFCDFRNLKQIHGWASHEKIKEVLAEKFGIEHIPCYYWLTCLISIIEPTSLEECFRSWVRSMLPEDLNGQTISLDGKTIRSTGKMACYESPIHIVSAQIAELGLTFGQEAVESKSNEIPAVQRLIKTLKVKGTIVVADALNCQKEIAKAIVEQGADYILSVKDNQATLKENIEDYVQDSGLRKNMDKSIMSEKNSGRIEKRIGYTTNNIEWLYSKENWRGVVCIGAINTQFTTPKGNSNEWHYYISSRNLTAEELLKHARLEWSVETMPLRG